MSRFVILQHDVSDGLHFDLMLEAGTYLKTWKLREPPQPGVEQSCEALPDHRLAYLDYEGPVSGERGSVSRWDHGACQVERQDAATWIVRLTGEKTVGTVTLRRESETSNGWRLQLVAT